MSSTGDEISEAPKKEEKKEWRYSVEEDNVTKSFTVREIENGFVTRKNIYGTDPKTDKYFDESSEFYSETNPLEGDNKDEALSEAEASSNVKSMAESIKKLF